MKPKEVFRRFKISDIVLRSDQDILKHIPITNPEGEFLQEAEVFFVGYENKDGNRCNEGGKLL